MEHEKLVLTETDKAQFGMLRAAGVIVELSLTDIPQHDGIIVFVCPDCDQYHDLEPRIAAIGMTSAGQTRPHTFKLNGGPLLLSTEALNKDDHEDRVLLKHAAMAQEMKGIEMVVCLGHAPCGAAYGAEMDLFTVVNRLVAAEDIVHERLGHDTPTLIPLHMDFGGGNGDKNLFRIDREAWRHHYGYRS